MVVKHGSWWSNMEPTLRNVRSHLDWPTSLSQRALVLGSTLPHTRYPFVHRCYVYRTLCSPPCQIAFVISHTRYPLLSPKPDTLVIPLGDCHAMLRMRQHGDHIASDIDVGGHVTKSLSNRVHPTCTISYPIECTKLAIECSA